MTPDKPEATIADYEALLEVALHTLYLEFVLIDGEHLHGALRPPAFALHDGTSRLGFWHPSRRVVSISLDIMLDDPWDQVVDVLKHEVSHAYTREVLGAQGEPPHGPTFRQACELLRIPPLRVHQATRRGDDAGGVAARIDELGGRYEGLLADLGADERHAYLSVGRNFGRIPVEQYALAAALYGLCGVVCLWVTVFDAQCGGWARRLQVCGPKANVKAAAHVHAALEQALDQQWGAFKNLFAWPTRRDRTSFMCSLLEAVCERHGTLPLPTADEGPSRAEDLDLGSWFHRRHPVRFDEGEASDRGETEPWKLGLFAGSKVEIRPPPPDAAAHLGSD